MLRNHLAKSFFLLLPFMSALSSFAQNTHKEITLDWNAQLGTFISQEGNKIQAPTFKGATHLASKASLPLYVADIACPAHTSCEVKIMNEVFEPVDESFYKNNTLDNQLNLQQQILTERKQNFLSVQLSTLRNTSKGVEKLVSFSIENIATPDRNARAGRAYSANSVLGKGKWIKVAVEQAGVYKLDYNFIKTNTATEPANTDFGKIGVYGNGGGMVPEKNNAPRFDDLQENAILRVDNNGNNRMDADDYILFYAQGADAWQYDNSTSRFTHQKNLYSDRNCYFITTTEATGKNIATVPSASSPNKTATTFTDYAVREKDEYNLIQSGREWFGDKMTASRPTLNFSFDFPNLITTEPVLYNSYVVGSSSYSSSISLTVNNSSIFTHTTSGIPDYTYKAGYMPSFNSGNFLSPSSTISVAYAFSNPDQGSTSAGYLNYFEANAKRALSLVGGAMSFRNPEVVGIGNSTAYTLSNANGSTAIWDVTDPTTAFKITATLLGSQLNFATNTSTLRELVAVNVSSSFSTPSFVSQVANQDLHSLGAQDYLIVTDPSLLSAANRLADFHRNKSGMTVYVADKNQIYNEFGSGKSDISAIRDFVKMFYDKAGTDSTKLPKYLCLFGDGSYDPKDRVKDNNNLVPTYQSYNSQYPLSSYVSDDFFGCLDFNEGGDINNVQRGDIAIGRLPLASATEAEGVVSKIIDYKSEPALGEWRNIVTSIGDDGEDGNGAIHEDQADKLGEYVRMNFPAYNVEKIILDAYKQLKTPGGDRYPDVNAAILNRINDGTLVISYTGHGGVSNWAHERIFNVSDFSKLKNRYRLPLFVTATCEFSRFDNPEKKTAGEFLMTNTGGGGIGLITTVRAVYSDANDALQNALYAQLFVNIAGKKPTLGQLMNNTKNAIMSGTEIENTRKFVFLGDPALTLNYPEYNVKTTHINGKSITSSQQDTLKALSYVTIKGEVQNWDGSLRTDFDGVCNPLVFDKLSTFKTLGNDAFVPIREYKIYNNSLFKGAATVTNGKFEYSFIVPQDINYKVGDGRISYYAASNQNIDAHGYQNDVLIGSSADSFGIDNQGPIVRLFMNNNQFKSGGITDENPFLYAELEDESGINATGNGIGHDIAAVLDKDSPNPIVLNEFYKSGLDNFKKGTVSYPFLKLAEGKHTLTIKAWDIHNNSGEDRTEFVVSTSAKLALLNVLNYPNPFVGKTCFSFESNRANEPLQVKIEIFSAIGAKVKTIETPFESNGYRVECLEWDGLDNMGAEIAKGVYIYRLSVTDELGNTAHQSNRLVLLK